MTMEDCTPASHVAVSPRDARQFVRRTLIADGHGGIVDDAELLVSEVVTNAVLHGGVVGAPISIESTSDGVRIEVVDPGSMFVPTTKAGDLLTPGGLGLGIVESLASRWGITPTYEGKVVWFELTAG